MRLWHYKLIPYLPKLQIVSLWRELNSIFVKQNKHILINYVYEYSKFHLYKYAILVRDALLEKNYNLNHDHFLEYFKNDIEFPTAADYLQNFTQLNPFPNHHNDRYLLQCFYNLQEKYDRGQKDFSKELYENLENFINSSNVN